MTQVERSDEAAPRWRDPAKEWELISSSLSSDTARLKVPGGWLYRECAWAEGTAQAPAVALCYVSDPFSELVPIVDLERAR